MSGCPGGFVAVLADTGPGSQARSGMILTSIFRIFLDRDWCDRSIIYNTPARSLCVP